MNTEDGSVQCRMCMSSWKKQLVPTFYVSQRARKGCFSTIQEAMRHAPPHSRIEIFNGTYRERVTIDKPVELVTSKAGLEQDGDPVVITHTRTPVILDVTEAYIEGIAIRVSEAVPALRIDSGAPLIRQCNLESVEVTGAANPTVELCRITGGSVSGVRVADRATGLYTKNTISEHVAYCVCVESSGEPVFSYNVISEGGRGQIQVRGPTQKGQPGAAGDADSSRGAYGVKSGSSVCSPQFLFNRIADQLSVAESATLGIPPHKMTNLRVREVGDRVVLMPIDRNTARVVDLSSLLNREDEPILASTNTRAAVDVANGSAQPRFTRNTIMSCQQNGFYIHSGGGGIFETNYVASNMGWGFLIEGNTTSPLIVGNHVRSNGGGAKVISAPVRIVQNNEFTDNRGPQLLLSNTHPKCLVEMCEIRSGNRVGLWCTGPSSGNASGNGGGAGTRFGGSIVNNVFGECATAMLVDELADPFVECNTFDACGVGVLACNGGTGTFLRNIFVEHSNVCVLVMSGAAPRFMNCRMMISAAAVQCVGSRGYFERCVFKSNRQVQVEISQGASPSFVNCVIAGGGGDGIRVGTHATGQFRHNAISHNSGAQVRILANGDPLFEENVIKHSSTDGIVVKDGGGGTFVSNIVSNCHGNGVAVEGSKSFPTLRANYISDCGAAGLALMDGVSGTYEKNTFLANAREHVRVVGSVVRAETDTSANTPAKSEAPGRSAAATALSNDTDHQEDADSEKKKKAETAQSHTSRYRVQKGPVMRGNAMLGSEGTGVGLEWGSEALLVGNVFHGCKRAVHAKGNSHVVMVSNAVKLSSNGISMTDGSSGVLVGNVLMDIVGSGITPTYSSSTRTVIVAWNALLRCGVSLHLHYSSRALCFQNVVRASSVAGVLMHNNGTVDCVQNVFEGPSGVGVRATETSSCIAFCKPSSSYMNGGVRVLGNVCLGRGRIVGILMSSSSSMGAFGAGGDLGADSDGAGGGMSPTNGGNSAAAGNSTALGGTSATDGTASLEVSLLVGNVVVDAIDGIRVQHSSGRLSARGNLLLNNRCGVRLEGTNPLAQCAIVSAAKGCDGSGDYSGNEGASLCAFQLQLQERFNSGTGGGTGGGGSCAGGAGGASGNSPGDRRRQKTLLASAAAAAAAAASRSGAGDPSRAKAKGLRYDAVDDGSGAYTTSFLLERSFVAFCRVGFVCESVDGVSATMRRCIWTHNNVGVAFVDDSACAGSALSESAPPLKRSTSSRGRGMANPPTNAGKGGRSACAVSLDRCVVNNSAVCGVLSVGAGPSDSAQAARECRRGDGGEVDSPTRSRSGLFRQRRSGMGNTMVVAGGGAGGVNGKVVRTSISKNFINLVAVDASTLDLEKCVLEAPVAFNCYCATGSSPQLGVCVLAGKAPSIERSASSQSASNSAAPTSSTPTVDAPQHKRSTMDATSSSQRALSSAVHTYLRSLERGGQNSSSSSPSADSQQTVLAAAGVVAFTTLYAAHKSITACHWAFLGRKRVIATPPTAAPVAARRSSPSISSSTQTGAMADADSKALALLREGFWQKTPSLWEDLYSIADVSVNTRLKVQRHSSVSSPVRFSQNKDAKTSAADFSQCQASLLYPTDLLSPFVVASASGAKGVSKINIAPLSNNTTVRDVNGADDGAGFNSSSSSCDSMDGGGPGGPFASHRTRASQNEQRTRESVSLQYDYACSGIWVDCDANPQLHQCALLDHNTTSTSDTGQQIFRFGTQYVPDAQRAREERLSKAVCTAAAEALAPGVPVVVLLHWVAGTSVQGRSQTRAPTSAESAPVKTVGNVRRNSRRRSVEKSPRGRRTSSIVSTAAQRRGGRGAERGQQPAADSMILTPTTASQPLSASSPSGLHLLWLNALLLMGSPVFRGSLSAMDDRDDEEEKRDSPVARHVSPTSPVSLPVIQKFDHERHHHADVVSGLLRAWAVVITPQHLEQYLHAQAAKRVRNSRSKDSFMASEIPSPTASSIPSPKLEAATTTASSVDVESLTEMQLFTAFTRYVTNNGIVAAHGARGTMRNCVLQRNTCAVRMEGEADPTLHSCVVRDHIGVALIVDAGARGCVTNCRLSSNKSIQVQLSGDSVRTNLQGNEFSDCRFPAIVCTANAMAVITRNRVTNTTNAAIIVERGAQPSVSKNTLHGCTRGLEYATGGGGVAEDNVISENTEKGISVSGAGTAPRLVQNRITGNKGPGIAVNGSGTNPSIMGNEIHANNGAGIELSGGAGGIVCMNRLSENNSCGIRVESSNGFFSGNAVIDTRGVGVSVSNCVETSPLFLSNAVIASTSHGVVVRSSQGAFARNRVWLNSGDGITVEGTASQMALEGNEMCANRGYGLSCRSGAAIHVQHAIVTANTTGGIYMDGAGTSPTISSSFVKGNFHFGIALANQASCEIVSSVVSHTSGGPGVRAAGGAAAPRLQRCLIMKNDGDGVRLEEECTATLNACVLFSNTKAGLAASGDEARVEMSQCLFVDGEEQGLCMRNGASGTVDQCVFLGKFAVAGADMGKDCAPRMTSCLFVGMRVGAVEQSSSRYEKCVFLSCPTGIELGGGAAFEECEIRACVAGVVCRSRTAQLIRCTVSGCAKHGVYLTATSATTVNECTIIASQRGVFADASAAGRVVNTLLYHNNDNVVIDGEAVQLEINGCYIYDAGHVGILLRNGAPRIINNTIFDNFYASVLVDAATQGAMLDDNKISFARDDGAVILSDPKTATALAQTRNVVRNGFTPPLSTVTKKTQVERQVYYRTIEDERAASTQFHTLLHVAERSAAEATYETTLSGIRISTPTNVSSALGASGAAAMDLAWLLNDGETDVEFGTERTKKMSMLVEELRSTALPTLFPNIKKSAGAPQDDATVANGADQNDAGSGANNNSNSNRGASRVPHPPSPKRSQSTIGASALPTDPFRRKWEEFGISTFNANGTIDDEIDGDVSAQNAQERSSSKRPGLPPTGGKRLTVKTTASRRRSTNASASFSSGRTGAMRSNAAFSGAAASAAGARKVLDSAAAALRSLSPDTAAAVREAARSLMAYLQFMQTSRTAGAAAGKKGDTSTEGTGAAADKSNGKSAAATKVKGQRPPLAPATSPSSPTDNATGSLSAGAAAAAMVGAAATNATATGGGGKSEDEPAAPFATLKTRLLALFEEARQPPNLNTTANPSGTTGASKSAAAATARGRMSSASISVNRAQRPSQALSSASSAGAATTTAAAALNASVPSTGAKKASNAMSASMSSNLVAAATPSGPESASPVSKRKSAR